MVAQTQKLITMSNIRKYIGLSLSFCMREILLNKISIDEIAAIVASTRFESWQEAYEHYFISYWSEYADDETCKRILQEVWPLVCQPRLNFSFAEHRGHMLSHGVWLNTFTGELTKNL